MMVYIQVCNSDPLVGLYIGSLRVCRLDPDLEQLLDLILVPMKVLNSVFPIEKWLVQHLELWLDFHLAHMLVHSYDSSKDLLMGPCMESLKVCWIIGWT